jgi:hypothetical protein
MNRVVVPASEAVVGPRRLGAVRSLVAALPDFGLAGLFLLAWLEPAGFDGTIVKDLALVLLLEFVAIHSAGLLGSVAASSRGRVAKVGLFAGLAIVYTAFVGCIALVAAVFWPLWAFWGLLGNRLLGLIVGRPEPGAERKLIRRSWITGVVLYVPAVVLTALIPLPALGLSDAIVAAQGMSGGGAWVDEPQRALAAGVLYFTALGVSELLDHRWMRL